MSQDVFPALAGLAWDVKKRPMMSTRISQHTSGKETRAANYRFPLWQFTLSYELLRNKTQADDLQTLMGFYLAHQGPWDTWQFSDPTDCHVDNQVLGTGDGSNKVFTFVRTLGSGSGTSFTEPVGKAKYQTAAVEVNGTPNSSWSFTYPNILTFASAPTLGAAVTASFDYWFVCRFLADDLEFSNFADKLWALQICEFQSVLNP